MCGNLQHRALGELGGLESGQMGLVLALFMVKQAPASSSQFLRGSCGDLGDHQQGETLQAGADWYFQAELLKIHPN